MNGYPVIVTLRLDLPDTVAERFVGHPDDDSAAWVEELGAAVVKCRGVELSPYVVSQALGTAPDITEMRLPSRRQFLSRVLGDGFFWARVAERIPRPMPGNLGVLIHDAVKAELELE
jgi:hypothetical protein